LELQGQKASLEAKAQQVDATNQEQTDTLATLGNKREALERRLAETEQSLKIVKETLDSLEKERHEAQLRTASLETTIDELATKLRDRDEAAKRDEQFLASDRDVRELMGARELYIADVTDVDSNGHKRQPFGLVFYTKGKSLIFYPSTSISNPRIATPRLPV
jgi:chromosome segregation ATPase